MLTFSNIKTRVLRLLDEARATSDQHESLVEEAINASHRRICLGQKWAFIKWPRRETLTTTSGTRTYALNANVGKLLDVWNSTHRRPVVFAPRRNWEMNGYDLSSTGVQGPDAILGDLWPVAAQPSSASTLRIVSSSAGDGSGEQVAIRGIDANGEIAEETLTANGTSQVAGTNSYTHILNVTKIGTWAGTMTLSTSGGTTLLTLTTAQVAKQYQTLEFIEPPGGAEVLTYSFSRIPRTLSAATDIPEVPVPFSEILVYDTLLDMTGYRTDTATEHQRLWVKRFDELWKQLSESQDEVIAAAQPRFVRDMDGRSGRPAQSFN
jgi:hypothetical protein